MKTEKLPPLVGTVRQIKWAEKIRKSCLDQLAFWDAALDKIDPAEDEEVLHKRLVLKNLLKEGCGWWAWRLFVDIDIIFYDDKIMKYPTLTTADRLEICRRFLAGIRAENTARWWIDHRDDSLEKMIAHRRYDYMSRVPETLDEEKKSILEEMTIRPENAITKDYAIINIGHDAMYTYMRKYCNEFNKCILENSFFCEPIKEWMLLKKEANGNIMDRAAEQIHRLLLAGIPVYCSDDEARARGIAGDFKPTYPRWLMKSKKHNLCVLRYDYDEKLIDELDKIRRLRKKYDKYYLCLDNWEVARHLETELGFKIEEEVERQLQHNQRVQADQTVKPAGYTPAPATIEKRTDYISDEIDDELYDDYDDYDDDD